VQQVDPPRQREIAHALSKARSLLEQCDVRSIPVDLARLAKRVGIRHVAELDTRLDGQLLELESGGYEVVLSKSAPATRKRFTLAHEIAHLLLFPREAAHNHRRETEELCNLVASELLIPTHFLAKLFPAGHAITIESLLKVPGLFRCSLEAAGWKILNSGLVSGALMIWKIESSGAGDFLELIGVPHTWGSQRVLDHGLRVHPGDWLWEAVMTAGKGTLRFPSMLKGMYYQGEFVRLRKVVLVFVADELRALTEKEVALSLRS
jgi:IrrE N-terminal-like domain